MSNLINLVNNRLEYINILTPEEMEAAQKFLEKLQINVGKFEKELAKSVSSSTIEYRFKIGEFLDKQIRGNNISTKERAYVWNEIKNLTQSDIEVMNDRGKRREFYEYCYRIFQFGENIAWRFTWSQWVDILDRSAALHDERFIRWLADRKQRITTENLRMLLLILNLFIEKKDLSVFTNEEICQQFDFLYKIVEQWNALFLKYFNSKKENLTDARYEKFTKYKKKFISDVLNKSKFARESEMELICEDSFRKNFVDIDQSANFQK